MDLCSPSSAVACWFLRGLALARCFESSLKAHYDLLQKDQLGLERTSNLTQERLSLSHILSDLSRIKCSGAPPPSVFLVCSRQVITFRTANAANGARDPCLDQSNERRCTFLNFELEVRWHSVGSASAQTIISASVKIPFAGPGGPY